MLPLFRVFPVLLFQISPDAFGLNTSPITDDSERFVQSCLFLDDLAYSSLFGA